MGGGWRAGIVKGRQNSGKSATKNPVISLSPGNTAWPFCSNMVKTLPEPAVKCGIGPGLGIGSLMAGLSDHLWDG